MDITTPHPLKELSFVSIFDNTDDVTWNALRRVGNAVARRVQMRGTCHIAIDASTEIEPLLHALARNSGTVPWDRTTITLTHEIFNDPNTPSPCADRLQRALLDHIDVPEGHFTPLRNTPQETLSDACARLSQNPLPPVDIALLSLSAHKFSAGAHLLSLFSPHKDPYQPHESTIALSASGLDLDAEHFLFSFGETVSQAVRNTLHILEQTALYSHSVSWMLDQDAARLCQPPFTSAPNTLSIDIGATGIKFGLLGPNGELVSTPTRIETPRPATPEAVLHVLQEHCTHNTQPFHRISVGFPGVINHDGTTLSAPNLDGDWSNNTLAFHLQEHTQVPVRIANDADVQGSAMFSGDGVELAFTLGTGFGSALAMDGVLVPNLEMGHHPFQGENTYEDLLGQPALTRDGFDVWFANLLKALETLTALFNPNHIHLGGGNTRLIHPKSLPDHVHIHNNVAGLLGGFALWGPEDHTS